MDVRGFTDRNADDVEIYSDCVTTLVCYTLTVWLH